MWPMGRLFEICAYFSKFDVIFNIQVTIIVVETIFDYQLIIKGKLDMDYLWDGVI
jgi:hypothetical protein